MMTKTTTTTSESEAARPELAVRLVVAYKLLRGTAEAAGAGVLFWLSGSAQTGRLQAIDEALEHHFVSGWSLRAARALSAAATSQHLRLVALALGLSAIVTLLEGVLLRRGARWASWLVVATTSAFIPFEIVELVIRFTAVRVLILLANLAIVWVLVRHVRRRAAPAPGRDGAAPP